MAFKQACVALLFLCVATAVEHKTSLSSCMQECKEQFTRCMRGCKVAEFIKKEACYDTLRYCSSLCNKLG
ncbi:hypothetical protein NP493_478g00018 [Ridgeia piscesae]|uniref:Uncharacterized protein n=1 Tax=Ridgeia piscesae TaxID=27915 RepID=A0AAD9KYF2_RIDPI|nr:hypothetical protein NP493_478g00018 [Ridgeia piscesae]